MRLSIEEQEDYTVEKVFLAYRAEIYLNDVKIDRCITAATKE
jgi:hypothetical protein